MNKWENLKFVIKFTISLLNRWLDKLEPEPEQSDNSGSSKKGPALVPQYGVQVPSYILIYLFFK